MAPRERKAKKLGPFTSLSLLLGPKFCLRSRTCEGFSMWLRVPGPRESSKSEVVYARARLLARGSTEVLTLTRPCESRACPFTRGPSSQTRGKWNEMRTQAGRGQRERERAQWSPSVNLPIIISITFSQSLSLSRAPVFTFKF